MIPLATERRSQPQQIAELQARLTLVTQTHAHAHRELTSAIGQLREIAQGQAEALADTDTVLNAHLENFLRFRGRSFWGRWRWLVMGR